MAPCISPVILCGGSGTRLWPLSTPDKPKQFQSLIGQTSMIGLTAARLHESTEKVRFDTPLIVGSARHETMLSSVLPEADLLLEPMGRNSAPAIAAACLMREPDALMLVLPADHHIANPAAFVEAIITGVHAASIGDIVTFGIVPTHAATGYGYIRASTATDGLQSVDAFVEKPAKHLAESYLANGSYYWNAGIFLFRVQTMLDAFKKHAPDILERVAPCMPAPDAKIPILEKDAFSTVPDISIDYAIMEKAERISLVPADMGWSDVGGYSALRELGTDLQDGSVRVGPIVAENSSGSYLRSDGPKLAVSGLPNMVVVATPETVMIAPIGDDTAVKHLGAQTQLQPLALSVSKETRTLAKDLLWASFDHWIDRAWDAERGGFVESLDLQGAPQAELQRRVRVQARQVFSFAEAARLNWSKDGRAESLIEQGIDFLDSQCRHIDGGWVHILDAQSNVVDSSRGLYDHAFIMMAGAAAWRSTGSKRGRQMSEEAYAFVDSELKDQALDGYSDGLDMVAARRANPHMHLLEAFLEWHGVTGETIWLDRATQVVEIFEDHLFVNRDDFLREHFTEDWTPAPNGRGDIFEPGHHYEWASLLADHHQRTGHDTASWRKRLIRKADQHGCDLASGLAYNEVNKDGTVTNASRRLWPQLEGFRARLWHPETAPPGAADVMLRRIAETYFSNMPPGIWMDEIDAHGEASAKAVPASMIYHMVTAFRDILPADDGGVV
ncbi:MAG: AGE family epimerase/isomerase [Pseudomonadota bacterium]